MKILAIETSCDETAIALVEAKGGLKKPQFKVLENIVSSQIAVHRPFGGVVPNLAKREHILNLPKLYQSLVAKSLPAGRQGKSLKFDLIAVTVGPGLEPALWAGIEFAKKLAKELKKPLVGGNHMEGHLYSNWIDSVRTIYNSKFLISKKGKKGKVKNRGIKFPAVALVVSGGHTILLKMDSLTKWKKLGETRDDAAGEAFDKVARLLGLQYPGGPEIEKLSKKGDPKAINFPRPMLRDKNYEFSFSGLKTSVLYYLRDNANKREGRANDANSSNNSHNIMQDSHYNVADVAASFQQAVIDVLVGKTVRAAEEFGSKSVLLCGGVAANKTLRAALELRASDYGLDFYAPDFQYNTDNAVMIAAAAYIAKLRGKKYPLRANSNLSL
ncbi:MAG: tRNA (adenosine(37)-N6)-threonylcarbamoyltransferase complex transferase subunit TsaD [bacterium]|nr:tRNA (adenosine(37)-N6)-threonylcarbamoyltransferase complex transferase subunit TsaD [bacterium]